MLGRNLYFGVTLVLIPNLFKVKLEKIAIFRHCRFEDVEVQLLPISASRPAEILDEIEHKRLEPHFGGNGISVAVYLEAQTVELVLEFYLLLARASNEAEHQLIYVHIHAEEVFVKLLVLFVVVYLLLHHALHFFYVLLLLRLLKNKRQVVFGELNPRVLLPLPLAVGIFYGRLFGHRF